MRRTKLQPWSGEVWALAAVQHGVITRTQLLDLGLSSGAVEHRIKRGRLYPLWRGVYAVGRPEVDRLGRWMAAVLSCGPDALLGNRSAAELWGLLTKPAPTIEVVVPAHVARRRPGIRVHRRGLRPEDRDVHHLIPVTSPLATLIDLAARPDREPLEAAVNSADRLNLIDPESLRTALDSEPPRPGLGRLRTLLDRQTFAPTDSVLERQFLAIVRAAKLPAPLTQASRRGIAVGSRPTAPRA